MLLLHPWTSSISTGSIVPAVATTPLTRPTAAMQMSRMPSIDQDAAGAMTLKKQHLQTLTAAEGTDAAMKKMSSSMRMEVVVEETGTAVGEKNRSGVSAAGGKRMRIGTWKQTRMLTEKGVVLGESVSEKMSEELTSMTGNAMLISDFWLLID